MYSRVLTGRFDNLPFLYFGPINVIIKKIYTFFGKSMENGWLYRESKNDYCPTSNAFSAISESPRWKTDATFSNQF